MGAIIIPVVLLILALGVITIALMRSARHAEGRKHAARAGEVESLRYHVPNGQDPAAVIGALSAEGYQAVRDSEAGTADVLVLCTAGRERERAHVRAVIEHVAPMDMEGSPMPPHAVTFADEPRSGG